MAVIELLLKGVPARVLIFEGLPRRAHMTFCVGSGKLPLFAKNIKSFNSKYMHLVCQAGA